MEWIQKRGYLLGTASLGLLVLGGYLALVWSPPDVQQHDAMRIMYVHVPTIMGAYLAFFLVLVGSIMYLWKRDLRWDRLAAWNNAPERTKDEVLRALRSVEA